MLASCGRTDEPGQSVGRAPDDGGPTGGRRVPQPSPEAVRAIPPHAIRADGVGPYRLGAPLRDILSRLRHGPRVELLQIEGIADYSLVRAERKEIVIGVHKPLGVTFVTVLGSAIARTEQEVGVGTTSAELHKKYGDSLRLRSYAADSRIFRPLALPGVRFVIANKRVQAVVVGRAPVIDEGAKSNCEPESFRKARPRVASVARLGPDAVVTFGCLSATERLALVRKGDRVQAVMSSTARSKRGPAATIPGVEQAWALDVDGDGRDELVAVVESRSGARRMIGVEVFRVDAQRLTSLVKEPVYSMDDSATAWMGARPADVSFLLEVEARGGLMTVSGLYLHRGILGVKEIVPLTTVSVLVRPRRAGDPPTEPGPTGADAGLGRPAVSKDAGAQGSK